MKPYRPIGIRILLLRTTPLVFALAFFQTPIAGENQQEAPPETTRILDEIQDLKRRIEALERELLKEKEEPEEEPVDLSEQEGQYLSTDHCS